MSASGGYIDLIILTCLFFLRGGGPSLLPGAIAGTQRPWRELVFPMKLGAWTIQMNLMILNSDDPQV